MSRVTEPGKTWWDPDGGKWRWHAPDPYHPDAHWDYNPWTSWNSHGNTSTRDGYVMDKESTDWLVGGFVEAGAYGPTILLQLQSLDAVQRLARAFRDTAQGSRSLEIAGEAGVRLDEIPRLELGLDDGIAGTRVTRNKDRPGFHWRGSPEGWRTRAQMLEPFLDGLAGHQYVEAVGPHDVLVEISYGESHRGFPAPKPA